jgi:hypothetical protein
MNKIIILLFANLLIIIQQSSAQTYKGIVLDAKTKEAVAYANVGILNKGYGVVCNEQGEFILKITTEKDSDIVQVFSIGYKPYYLPVKRMKETGENNVLSISLSEASYELATINVRPNDYETKIVGGKDVGEFKCEGKVNISSGAKDTATLRMEKEKGISNKSIGFELGNKIKIDKGQQTFIDKIRFKTCLKPNDTCVYRINIYQEGSTKERHMTPIGMVKIINTTNVLKVPVITKVIGKSEVQELDVSAQNIEVDDDFIIAIECIYTSNNDMNIAMKTSVFGATDLLVRSNTMAEWAKIPLLDITFVSATVTYKKEKGFWYKLFN